MVTGFFNQAIHKILKTSKWIILGTLFTLLPFAAVSQTNELQITLDREAVIKAQIRPGTTQTIRTDVEFADIVVGNQAVADVVPLSDTSLYIQGKAIGLTNVTLFDADRRLLGVIDVSVAVDPKGVESAVKAAVPTSRISVTNVGSRIRVAGEVQSPTDLPKVIEAAQQFSTEPVITAVSIGAAQQVSLEVRVLEAARSIGRNVGVNILADTSNGGIFTTGDRSSIDLFEVTSPDGTSFNEFQTAILGGQGAVSTAVGNSLPFGSFLANILNVGGTDVDALIEVLEDKSLARSLAQPNLTTVSGEAARFVAGGEVPIESSVAAGGGLVSDVEFRPFGVRLEFVPTVLDGGKVNVRVLTEVSDIDPTIDVNGNPGFSTNRAETVVELRDGQSFHLAGLLQTDNDRALQQVPYLGQIPILGSLFRSSAFQKAETELVIIITPRIVRPADPSEELADPLSHIRPSNDFELFGLGLLEVDKDDLRRFRDGTGIVGPYGHIIDLEFDDAFVAKK